MANKWQRIKYMPAMPLEGYDHMMTACEEHRALSRRAAADSIIMLKNEDSLLPLAHGTRLAVFGKASIDYVKGGGGSGDVTVSYVRSLVDGLTEKQAEGKVNCYQPLTAFYLNDVSAQYAAGKTPGQTVEPELSADLVADARAFADTALITICRYSGEGWDRTGQPHDGDFYLSLAEEAMVSQVLAAFPKVVVILNAGGMMDTRWFKDEPRVQAALNAGQGGMEGGCAIADILCGDVCPSAHLIDTYAEDFAAYPSSANFNESEDYVAYEDDIYVGYRYFETIPGAAEKVLYPFGFGLSYTTFDVKPAMKHEGMTVKAYAAVTNTGSTAGREVVQLYASAPQGKLGKPARVLVSFAKTPVLAPGEQCTVDLSFPVYAMASYDDLGKVAKSCWLLEKGEYTFWCGENVRDAKQCELTITLDDDLMLEQLTEKCAPHDLKRRLTANGAWEEMPPAVPSGRPLDASYPREQRPDEWYEPDTANCWQPLDRVQLIDVWEGKVSMDDFIDRLTPLQMVHLLGGQPNRGSANTFGFGNLPYYGIPNVMTADGPAGLRFTPETGVHTTAFPTASSIAATWDVELAREIGAAGGLEVKENGIGVWLTPAINIHRSPLCGRNFEYYSEDPLLTGRMAAAMVEGIQSNHVACSLKHYAANNKETNRMESDSRVSERALREIYLKGFEICVKEADPWTVMSSYNLINGTRASQNADLINGVLRGEWGFKGMVTTDWYAHSDQYLEIAAGNDVKMGRGMLEHCMQMLDEGKLSLADVKTAVKHVLELFMKLD